MTDECAKISGKGSWISEFVGAGPKNYGFKVVAPNGEVTTVVKIRGFTLNFKNSLKLNCEVLKKLIFSFVQKRKVKKVKIRESRIVCRKPFIVVTSRVRKDYGVVYDKRMICADFTTRPFGYY